MEPRHLMSVLWFHVILLSIYFPCFFCQNITCHGGPFGCGSVQYITYPFWGGARTRDCGRLGFDLSCHDNVPMLNISSLTYRVLKLDFSSNTLVIAREDLLNNTCPKIIRNTTIDLDLFKYSSESEKNHVTLFYDCSDENGEPGYMESIPNRLSCDGTINLFYESPAGPGPNITCRDSISVPVSKNAAHSLENPTSSSINILQAALLSGFPVTWLPDGNETYLPFCNRDVYSSCTRRTRRPCNYANACGRGGGDLVAVSMPAAQESHQGILLHCCFQVPIMCSYIFFFFIYLHTSN